MSRIVGLNSMVDQSHKPDVKPASPRNFQMGESSTKPDRAGDTNASWPAGAVHPEVSADVVRRLIQGLRRASKRGMEH
jgi:hypothetical protein